MKKMIAQDSLTQVLAYFRAAQEHGNVTEHFTSLPVPAQLDVAYALFDLLCHGDDNVSIRWDSLAQHVDLPTETLQRAFPSQDAALRVARGVAVSMMMPIFAQLPEAFSQFAVPGSAS